MASKSVKIQFKSKHRMLLDFGNTIMDSESTIAASVAKRHFDKYYPLFVDAYETLMGIEECSSEEFGEYSAQFSEVNTLLIKLEQKLCHEVSSPVKEVNPGVSKESQKLPVRIRSLFEERYGKSRDDLPTLEQLIELLDEQCRVYQAVSKPTWVSAPRPSTSHRGRTVPGRGTATTSHSKGVSSSAPRKVESARQSYQVTTNTCSYCDQSDQTLYKCDSFRHLDPSQRKSWARKSGHCFKRLRKNYAKECQHTNWCYHCGSKEHNSLICLEPKGSGKERADTQAVAATEPFQVNQGGRSSPPRTVNSSSNEHQPITYQKLRPRVGERAAQAQAQFNNLRYGLRMSPDLE